jgi:hypothetical protein
MINNPQFNNKNGLISLGKRRLLYQFKWKVSNHLMCTAVANTNAYGTNMHGHAVVVSTASSGDGMNMDGHAVVVTTASSGGACPNRGNGEGAGGASGNTKADSTDMRMHAKVVTTVSSGGARPNRGDREGASGASGRMFLTRGRHLINLEVALPCEGRLVLEEDGAEGRRGGLRRLLGAGCGDGNQRRQEMGQLWFWRGAAPAVRRRWRRVGASG